MKVNELKPDVSGGKRRFGRFLLVVLLAVCLCGAGLLGYMGMAELRERQQGDNFYAELAASVETATEKHGADGQTGTQSAEAADASGNIYQSDRLAPEKRIVNSEIDFRTIWESCPDVVGWVRIEDSSIDYPIVLGDDNDFYLNHLPDGTANKAGSIMMDEANNGNFRETVNILHGHHMRNGSMFGALDDYSDEEYFKAHSTIRLYTPAGDYDVAIFAAFTVNGYTFGYPTSFDNETEFEQFIRRAIAATPYETGVDVAYGDRILMLSTCAYSYSGARYVVMGKICDEHTP